MNDKPAAFLDARNLTDESYVSNVQAVMRVPAPPPAQPAVFWPGAGRAVFAGVTVAF